jgi:hypothetical protein
VAKCRQLAEKPIFAFANFLFQYDGVFGVDTEKIKTKFDPWLVYFYLHIHEHTVDFTNTGFDWDNLWIQWLVAVVPKVGMR